jgi:hypothetical protein
MNRRDRIDTPDERMFDLERDWIATGWRFVWLAVTAAASALLLALMLPPKR